MQCNKYFDSVSIHSKGDTNCISSQPNTFFRQETNALTCWPILFTMVSCYTELNMRQNNQYTPTWDVITTCHIDFWPFVISMHFTF